MYLFFKLVLLISDTEHLNDEMWNVEIYYLKNSNDDEYLKSQNFYWDPFICIFAFYWLMSDSKNFAIECYKFECCIELF